MTTSLNDQINEILVNDIYVQSYKQKWAKIKKGLRRLGVKVATGAPTHVLLNYQKFKNNEHVDISLKICSLNTKYCIIILSCFYAYNSTHCHQMHN